MRILFITDNFPPEVNAPASRTYEHCREWVYLGHDVTVITCNPNFPQGVLYQGYQNRLASQEVMDGIQVIRVWSYISANQGFIKRILDYLSFMLSAVIVSQKLGSYDKLVGTSPQFFSAVAAYLIGAFKSTPYIFELRDIWPESIRAVGAMKNSRVLDIFEKFELYLYKRSNHIISVTHSFKKNLVNRNIPPSKVSVVINGVDLNRFFKRPKDNQLSTQLGLDHSFVAGYIGTHGMAHALDSIIDAAKILQNLTDEDIKFLFIGSGAEKAALMKQAEQQKLNNVVFVDSVAKEEVPRYWSLLDVSIVHLKDTPLFKTVIPSKIFESMGMGIPIIHGVLGESAQIIETESTGWIVQPEQPDEVVKTLLKAFRNKELLRAISQNCQMAALKYQRPAQAKKMLVILCND
jgi:glycosyltransferase involved in cell wall biosynthesis